LRLPPVTVQASGIPVAPTRRWYLESHARLLPLDHPPGAGRATAVAELERQMQPADPGIPCSACRWGKRFRPG
jgi:hypothetical protein